MVWLSHGQSRASFALLCLCLCACQGPARIVQTVLDPYGVDAQTELPTHTPPDSAGPDGPPITQEPAAGSCPSNLDQRTSVSSVQLERDIRYKLLGYGGFPFDERVAFAAAPSGGGYVAWTEDATGRVWVTPLNARYERAGADIDTKASEVGGIVAHDDGFALLTLRDDPAGTATPTPDSNFGRAVMLVRYRNGKEVFAVPLTGAKSVTRPYIDVAGDSAPGYLYGRLAWNGSKYGAYFIIQVAPKDSVSGFTMTDKLVYLDAAGSGMRGGFVGKCTSNQGLRLWPEADAFTPVCISDGAPSPGVNLVVEGADPVLLGREAFASGWSAGQMGSIVKLPDDNSYFVGWLSRDVVPGGQDNQTARFTTDIALVRLGADHQMIGQKRWLVETQSAAETNLHFARYGQSQILMAWDSIVGVRCDRMCFGSYAGTYARVLDREGNVISGGSVSAVPNHHDDLTTLPNGDVAWAYVPDESRDYSSVPPSRDDRVLAPPKRTINIARLRYCEPPKL